MVDTERWLLRRRFDESFLQLVPGLDPIAARVLYARHLDSLPAIDRFLSPPLSLADPWLLPDLPKAVERIRAAIDGQEPIVVYGDFDADGMCAATLLTAALERCGAKVRAYIPDRFDEGYGLNSSALARLQADGASLVVTVDCGIRSSAEVATAQAQGLDVIVTDHHSVPATLPPALAVVDPKRPDSLYPFADLAGTGVAFRLAQALLDDQGDEFLDLVAVATVADIVPLVGENRALVRAGLERLRSEPRPGLAALMHSAGIAPGTVTSADIAFRLAPRLNAAGRLANARLGYTLLSSLSEGEAQAPAEQLEALNRQRQEMLDEQHRLAQDALGEAADGLCLFVALKGLHQGIVGLIASRLCEEHYRPTFVMTPTDAGLTGSARSIAGFHVTHALEGCADLLERFGGHEAAAGFTVRTGALPEFQARLLERAAETLGADDLVLSRRVDAIVDLQDLGLATPRALAQLGPFGEGNPEPLLASQGLAVTQVARMGREGRHLRLRVSGGAGAVKCVGWGLGDLADRLTTASRIDLLYTPEIDTYNGQEALQLNIVSLRLAQ